MQVVSSRMKGHFRVPGTAQTMSFCLHRKKGESLEKKAKTIKSICRRNVNTACWVADHLVGKRHLSLGELQAPFPPTTVSEQAGHPGPGLQTIQEPQTPNSQSLLHGHPLSSCPSEQCFGAILKAALLWETRWQSRKT